LYRIVQAFWPRNRRSVGGNKLGFDPEILNNPRRLIKKRYFYEGSEIVL